MAKERLGQDPVQGSALFVFAGRSAQRLKLLWFERNGLCLLYKRLHGAVFKLPLGEGDALTLCIDTVALAQLLTIRADARCSAFAATSPLVAFLATLPELRKTGPVAFEAAEGQPWVAVIVTVCSPEGNYASGGAYLPQVNVVELVCSDAGDPAWYDALAGRIAEFLGWSAFEDHEEQQLERLLDGRRER